MFNSKVFFDAVRGSLFSGRMTDQQVAGMEFDLDHWTKNHDGRDLRHLAYCMGTEYWEVGGRMWPVREGFKETDAAARKYVKDQGYAYAKVDPVTGQVYYGRGKIQITWGENYRKSSDRLGLTGTDKDLYLNPDMALDLEIATINLMRGMIEGWYRKDTKGLQTLDRYFNTTTDDPYTAREIVNGDKSKVPGWTNGVSIGKMIAGYHDKFLSALRESYREPVPPEPPVAPEFVTHYFTLKVVVPAGVTPTVTVEPIG
jgi:hypothetical protein